MKYRASIGMSSARSRSGGIVIGNTDSRKYRSSRYWRAATAAFRFRLVAATTRTSTCSGAVPPTRSKRFSSSARRILACRAERQVADFVEKQRAAMRQLELAGLARRRAGERALFVAEQLRLEQVLGDRRAVDRDKRSVGARAQRVQRSRKQLLAGAALAFEQHRRVGRRRAMQRHGDLLQLRIFADDLRRAAALRQLLLQQDVLGRQPPLRERALDHQQQMIGIDRLGEKVERAFLHRRDRVLNAAERGHHDDRQLRIELLGRAKHAEAIALRAAADPTARRPAARSRSACDGFGLVARFDHRVALRLERMAQHGAQRVFVLDEQNGRIGGAAGHYRSQPGGTPARRASSSRSAIAFCLVDDRLLQPVELGERLLAVGGDDGALRGIVAVDEVSGQRVDARLQRLGIGLVAIQLVVQSLLTTRPVPTDP